jgi:capsular polysaccharide biosynthesis protein
MERSMKDYFGILLRKWWIIAVIVVAGCGLTATYDTMSSQPVYEAQTKLIVNESDQTQGLVRLDTNLINSNIMLIETYKEIIATPAIMEKVKASHPEITEEVTDLISRVKVTSSDGSQVMNISIRDTSVSQAVLLVNAIAEVFKTEIPQIMNVDNVTILSYAKAADYNKPVSYGLLFKLFIALALSLFVAVGFVFLLEYMDDTVKTDKDVSQFLGLPTLAVIGRMKKSDVEIKRGTTKENRIGETIHASVNQ